VRKALVGLVGAVGMIGLVIVAGFSAYASAAPKGPTKRAFTETIVGAQISGNASSDEEVFKVVNSLDGTGAGIVDNSTPGTSFPVSGTNTGTIYFANGVSKRTEKFVLNAPNASGIIAYTGSGKCVGGTGVHKKEKCAYSFKGVFNTKTGIDKAKETGTDTR
jgi:hypothetical protein